MQGDSGCGDNSCASGGILSPDFLIAGFVLSGMWYRREMKAMKILRNIIGTAGLIYAGYVLLASVKDVRRYIRISTM
jgi:hypothetical protein